MNVAGSGGARPFDPTEDLSPTAIEAFLEQSGWQREELREGVSSTWSLPEADASIMVPRNRSYRDFRARLSDALRAISDIYELRTAQALELEITGARNDILLLRTDQATPDGSIPLGEAQNLLKGLHLMLTAAACSAVKPTASIPRRRPNAAREFMAEEVRMGHTLRGSFVMTIYARHDETRAEELPDVTGSALGGSRHADAHNATPPRMISYTRRVLATLSTGLQAANELLKPIPRISLEEAVELGASAELIDSVGIMSLQPGIRSLDMSFKWSPSQPLVPTAQVNRIVVPRPEQERVEHIRDSLRERPMPEADQIIGQVVRLERAEGDDNGIVVIDGHLGKVRRRVKVELSGATYQLAIRAHEEQHPIIASGELALENRSWWIKGDVTLRQANQNIE